MLERIESQIGVVAVADDHELYRAAIVQLLKSLDNDCRTIEAAHFQELLEIARLEPQALPEVIFLDLDMPGRSPGGHAASVAMIQEAFPKASIVILSGTYDAGTVVSCMKAGARGFLPKIARRNMVASAIRHILDGEIFVPPTLVFDEHLTHVTAPTVSGDRSSGATVLSPREESVVKLMASGHTNKEIGAALGISEMTSKTHVARIVKKLGARNRVQAVRIALERKLV